MAFKKSLNTDLSGRIEIFMKTWDHQILFETHLISQDTKLAEPIKNELNIPTIASKKCHSCKRFARSFTCTTNSHPNEHPSPSRFFIQCFCEITYKYPHMTKQRLPHLFFFVSFQQKSFIFIALNFSFICFFSSFSCSCAANSQLFLMDSHFSWLLHCLLLF